MKLKIEKSILIFSFCCSFLLINSQEETNLFKHALGFDIAIPNTISNQLFSSNFDEVAEIGLNYDFMIFKNISLGVSYRYSYFELSRRAFPVNIVGQFDSHFAGVTTSMHKHLNDRSYLKTGLSIGYNQVFRRATGFENINPNESNLFISPYLGVFIYNDEVGSVGLIANISYSEYIYNMDLKNPNASFIPSNTIFDKMSWFAVGFKYEFLVK